jgi:hypothetical protein
MYSWDEALGIRGLALLLNHQSAVTLRKGLFLLVADILALAVQAVGVASLSP